MSSELYGQHEFQDAMRTVHLKHGYRLWPNSPIKVLAGLTPERNGCFEIFVEGDWDGFVTSLKELSLRIDRIFSMNAEVWPDRFFSDTWDAAGLNREAFLKLYFGE